MKNILLTGRPGVGKTTVVMEFLKRLCGIPVTGFYTEEIREEGTRKGFLAVTLDGKDAILSHVEIKSPQRVGKYGVDVRGFETNILPVIDPDLNDAELFIVDEIGKMECFSARFRELILKLLNSEKILLATIAFRGNPFIESLKKGQDVRIIEVTRSNRDHLADEIIGELRGQSCLT